MNIHMRFTTFAEVENTEVFVINLHGRCYMGWRQEETIWRSIDYTGASGQFDLNAIDSETDVFVIGTTTQLADVRNYAHWFVSESAERQRHAAYLTSLEALQSMAALRQVTQVTELGESL